MALTRTDLDQMKCATPGCTCDLSHGLTLHSKCHGSSPTWSRYDFKTGNIVVTCSVCDRTVAEVGVKA